MNLHITKCAFAVSAALASITAFAQVALPVPTSGPLDIWYKAPLAGATVSGTLSNEKCYINGVGVTRVDFYLDSTLLNADTNMADGMSCVLDTSKFANGTHQLKAVARNSTGATYTELRSINIQNTVTNTPPKVSFTVPAAGATASGTIAYSANATDNAGVARVDFLLDSTALGTRTAAPYSGNLDTTKLANGTHIIKATAYDAQGLSASSQVSINVQNAAATPPPTGTLTPPGSGTLDIWWKAPSAGQTVSGTLSLDKCYIRGNGVTKVDFFLDSTALNSDTNVADGMSCALDTTKFANGTHQLKAVARNAAGATYNEVVSINIQNSSTTPPPPPPTTTNAAPTVSLTAPATGATVSGMLAYAANATDNAGVARVDFFADATSLGSKTAAPYSGSLDTKTLADGAHVIKAVAYDAQGLSATTQVSVNVKNAASTLPSTGTKAIATFESIGLYWTPGTNPGAAGCQVQFRKLGDTTWKDGLAMWYDARNSECRGSLVHLSPNTTYEVQFNLPGQAASRALTAKTWNESLPIAQTITVPSGSSTLNITQGGSPSGYVLYTAAAGGSTIDVNNAQDYNVVISAPYVILRGFTLKGARINAVHVTAGNDIVIEGNDISNWGRPSGKMSAAGYMIGTNMDSGIHARCSSTFTMERSIIQRNKIHHPRYGSNSWSEGHPSGPNGVFFSECAGNHVFRYNEIYSSTGHYFMDAYGGEENFGLKGMPNADSDLYGNKISHTWDDAIEAEGANRNVRVWGNYFDNTSVGVATTASSVGPIYIWRNVWNRSRFMELQSAEADPRGLMFKSGNGGGYGDGRRYVFHNTMLQMPAPAGSTLTLGGAEGLSGPSSHEPMVNTISRNNVFHIYKSWWTALNTQGGAGNDLDYDLYNGNVSGISGAELRGTVGTPIYATGNGPASDAGGMYQLAPTSPGFDKAARIPNFNDSFTGAAPDAGAHEAGTPAMKFGVNQ